MSLSRKHYKLVAELLVRVVPDKIMRKMLCTELGRIFAKDNPAFDWSKWRSACECE